MAEEAGRAGQRRHKKGSRDILCYTRGRETMLSYLSGEPEGVEGLRRGGGGLGEGQLGKQSDD